MKSFFLKLLDHINQEIIEKAVFKPNFIDEQGASKNLSVFFEDKKILNFKSLNPEILESFKKALENNRFYKESNVKYENIGTSKGSHTVKNVTMFNIQEDVKKIKEKNDVILDQFKSGEIDEISCFNSLKQNLISKHFLLNNSIPLSKNLRIRKQVRSLMAASKGLKRQQLTYDIDYYGVSFKGSSLLLNSSDPLFSTYYPDFLTGSLKENKEKEENTEKEIETKEKKKKK